MTFSIESPTKAKLMNLEVLSQKNRQPDENPGVKLTIGEINLPADALAHFDGALRSFLFDRVPAKQGELNGMETEKLTRAGTRVGTLKWKETFAGHTLVIERGTGGRSNLNLADCEISGIRLTPKDGGSCTMKANFEAGDASEQLFGKLAKLKSCEITITLQPPEVKQGDIEDPAPTRKPSPKAAAPLPAPTPPASRTN